MRIVWAAVVWIVFVGGLLSYMSQRGSAVEVLPETAVVETAGDVYDLVLTTTFTAQPDPFALTAGDAPPAALQVRLGSQVLLRKTDGVLPGHPIRVPVEAGLVKGTNEIFIEVSPPLDSADQAQAVHVEVQRGSLTVAEATYWAAAGGTIAETFRFHIEERQEETGDDH